MSGADNDKGLAIEYAEKGGEFKLYGEYGVSQRRKVNSEVERLRRIGYEVRVQGLAFDPRERRPK